MMVLIIGTFSGHGGALGFNKAFFLFTLIFAIPGYSLYSLWWLIFKFRNITKFSMIPININFGLIGRCAFSNLDGFAI